MGIYAYVHIVGIHTRGVSPKAVVKRLSTENVLSSMFAASWWYKSSIIFVSVDCRPCYAICSVYL